MTNCPMVGSFFVLSDNPAFLSQFVVIRIKQPNVSQIMSDIMCKVC